MNADERRLDSLTERILGAVFEVSNVLGCGFLEKLYERALLRELTLQGIRAKTQSSCPVTYKGRCIGEYFADLIVEGVVLVEVKACDALHPVHTAQCINYLAATRIRDFPRQRRDIPVLQAGLEQPAIEIAVVADGRTEGDVEVEAEHGELLIADCCLAISD